MEHVHRFYYCTKYDPYVPNSIQTETRTRMNERERERERCVWITEPNHTYVKRWNETPTATCNQIFQSSDFISREKERERTRVDEIWKFSICLRYTHSISPTKTTIWTLCILVVISVEWITCAEDVYIKFSKLIWDIDSIFLLLPEFGYVPVGLIEFCFCNKFRLRSSSRPLWTKTIVFDSASKQIEVCARNARKTISFSEAQP